ncbi:MAG: SDR family NAD(P)-dependent oxidoreductase [Phycisphaerae bacterium]
MSTELLDRVMVITGASSGIGAATALHCARAGMHVVLTARRRDRLDALAGQVRALGREAEVLAGDAADPDLAERLLDAAERRFRRFDVVFANAGYGIRRAAHETSMPELRAIFEVNFFAACDLLRLAARRLLAAKRTGHLLMCSSCVAKFTLPECSAYSATKAAQNHVCRAMRMELRRFGIEVSSVLPVRTATEFFEAAAERSGLARPAAVSGPMTQSADVVARAVVRCLRRPVPEVWTSFSARFGASLMTLFPRFMDFVARRV